MAKSNFDENIRSAMKPPTPRKDARADGAGADQTATGREVVKPGAPQQPEQMAQHQIPDGLPPHLAAAASIAHAIINNRPAK